MSTLKNYAEVLKETNSVMAKIFHFSIWVARRPITFDFFVDLCISLVSLGLLR